MNKKNYIYGKNIDGKNLLPELTRSKANTKAIAFCHHKLQRLIVSKFNNSNIGTVNAIQKKCVYLHEMGEQIKSSLLIKILLQ